MLQVTQDGTPIGEMRYHVTRIKSEDDVTRFCEEIEEVIPGSFTSTPSQDALGRPQQIFTYNTSSFADASENQQSDAASEIHRVAEELRIRNSGEDTETAVLKRIREANRKIKSSREGYENLDNYTNQIMLRTKLTELARDIRDYLETIE